MPCENRLAIDDRRADDEANRDCELKNDEPDAKAARARRFRRRAIGLEDLSWLKPRKKKAG